MVKNRKTWEEYKMKNNCHQNFVETNFYFVPEMPNFEEIELRLKVNVAGHSFSYCILLKSGGKLFLCFRDKIIGASSMPFYEVKVHLNSADATWSERATLVYNINHSRPQSLLGALVLRSPVGSGDENEH